MTTLLARQATTTPTTTDFSEQSGYKPELKRTLSSFQMFAISFASVSVVIGVFATYNDVLQNSGPVGHLAVSGRGGGAGPGGVGVRAIRGADPAQRFVLPVGFPAGQPEGRLDLRLDRVVEYRAEPGGHRQCDGEPMPDATVQHGSERNTARVITVLLLMIQAVIVIASVRIVGWTNSLAVGVELAIVVVLGIGLDRRGRRHRTWHDAESVHPGYRRRLTELLRARWRIDGGVDHGSVDAGRLRGLREHG